MSFPGANPPPPPPPSSLPLCIPRGDVDAFCRQFPINHEHPDSRSQHENVPQYKGLINSENNPPNSGHLSPKNLLTNTPYNEGGKGTHHIFYKTRICAKFLRGTCGNRELCTFAHGLKDLREPPPNWQEFVPEKDRGSDDLNDEERFIQTMMICKRYYNGEECPYGSRCNFLHEMPTKFKNHMEKQWESSAISIVTAESIMGSRSTNEQLENKHVNPNFEAFLVKPACSKWEITGKRPSGERSHFARGRSELQLPGGHIEAGNQKKIEQEDKGIRKWKFSRKISGIYGDWIDGFMPLHDLPSTDES